MNRFSFVLVLSLFAGAQSACDNGFTQVNKDCYRLFTLYQDYTTAEKTCLNYGSHLASIHSSQERASLNNIIGNSNPLIGLQCNTTYSCSWSDGSFVDYTNFPSGAPTLSYGSCAHLSSQDDLWYSWNCATPTSSFLCKAYNANNCPSGYTPYNGGCASVKTYAESADDAELTCQIEGGHLASIHTEQDTIFYQQLLSQSGVYSNFHIGIRYNNLAYSWTDNSAFNYYNWASAFPDTHFGLCGQFLGTYEYGLPGQWTNIPCQQPLPFVCFKGDTYSPTYAPLNCPSMQYFEDYGTVYSPGFPVSLPNNSHCEYLLAGVIGTTLSVTFPYFNLDNYTTLTLYDGMSVTYPMALLSGTWPTGITYRTTQNILKMVFDTPSFVTGTGWEANFQTIQPYTVPPTQRTTPTTPRTTARTSPYYTTAITTNHTCPDQFIYANSMVNSPGFPLGYPKNANCFYYISSPPNKRMTLEFEYVDTKKNVDFIIIRDGPNDNSIEIGRLSGGTLQNNLRYISTANYLTIQFTSDNTKGGSGFTATVDQTN